MNKTDIIKELGEDKFKQVLLYIHQALHGTSKVVTFTNRTVPIRVSNSNGCRFVMYWDTCIMVQNKAKLSNYAKRAREGEQLTWAMFDDSWILIPDNL